jgi:uncharacterized protein (TIGR00730 family)
LDHTGYLPRLVKQGFQGRILATRATSQLAELILLDSAKNQEHDADYANRQGFSRHKPALPLYDAQDARVALDRMQVIRRGEWLSIAGPVWMRLHDAGHLLGSSMIETEIRGRNPPLRILFSGDVGRFDGPLYHDPAPPPECDYLICESTYGGRAHPAGDVTESLAAVVHHSIDRGGVMLVSSFAIGRAQQFIYLLQLLMHQRRIPRIPVFVDSPMAVDATHIYYDHREDHDLSEGELSGRNSVLKGPNVHFARSVEQSKRLNSISGPAVIISSSGMMEGGRILHHLRHRLSDARNTIILGGFMAAGTRGRKLQEGAATLRMHGQDVPVRAAIETIPGLSGHADHGELLRWLQPLRAPNRQPARPWHKRSAKTARGMSSCRDWVKKSFWRISPRGSIQTSASMQNQDSMVILMRTDEQDNLQAILNSPSYRLAELDTQLLQRSELRPVRVQLELLKPELLLEEQQIRSTIVVFGSTQIVERAQAERLLESSRLALAADTRSARRAREVARNERLLAKCHYYDAAREFARIVSSACQKDGHCDYVVVTGGGPGIMEAANRGAFDVGAKSAGLNITLPAEQVPNPYITPELCFQFHYFAMRKFHFLLRAAALVVFPGGFGTLDELFDALTLRQTQRMQQIPIVLYSRQYWDRVLDFQFLADEGVIADEHLNLISYAESPREAWDRIAQFTGETTRFLNDE